MSESQALLHAASGTRPEMDAASERDANATITFFDQKLRTSTDTDFENFGSVIEHSSIRSPFAKQRAVEADPLAQSRTSYSNQFDTSDAGQDWRMTTTPVMPGLDLIVALLASFQAWSFSGL